MDRCKVVCPKHELTNLKEMLQKMDDVDDSAKDGANNKRNLQAYKRFSLCFVTLRYTHGL